MAVILMKAWASIWFRKRISQQRQFRNFLRAMGAIATK
jgi:hypothetical protein